jgi:hypothetical protein
MGACIWQMNPNVCETTETTHGVQFLKLQLYAKLSWQQKICFYATPKGDRGAEQGFYNSFLPFNTLDSSPKD